MQQNIHKIEEIQADGIVPVKEKKDLSILKGRLAIINPSESQIAKELKITEKGVYAVRRK